MASVFALPTSRALALSAAALVTTLSAQAQAASPTYYNNQAMFQADITNTVTDDYSNPAYVFNQNNMQMSAVLGETDYMSTGHNNLNLIVNNNDPRYCSGCNGSFELSFLTTSVGTPIGVNGVGFDIDASDNTYFAFITFADGTTDNVQLPGANTFWAVAAPERIESIHIGLTMGGTTTNGYFEMDNLIVGDGNVGGCDMDADCFDNGDPCTDPVCVMGMCQFAPNVDPCDDGNPCTEMDVCANGVCDGAPVSCDDGNECTDEFCDPAAGCIIQLNSNPCDDGDVCTEMDMCNMGMCGGVLLDCNDDNVCSMDSCDPVMGCMNDPVAGCCLVDEDCGEEEMCDPAMNVCVPIPSGDSSTGAGDDTSTGGGMGDDTSTGGGGADESGDSDTGGGSGVGDTGVLTSGGMDSTGIGGGGSGTSAGEVPSPDFNTCECRADPSPQGRLWWLMVVFGAVARRRRRAA